MIEKEFYISERDFGFLEGMIEGEGYIGLLKQRSKLTRSGFTWKPFVSISNNNLGLLKKLKRIVDGGWIVNKRGTSYEYRLNPNKMRLLLPKMALIVKKEQTKLLLEALKILRENIVIKKYNKINTNFEKLERIRNQIKILYSKNKKIN